MVRLIDDMMCELVVNSLCAKKLLNVWVELIWGVQSHIELTNNGVVDVNMKL